MLKLFVLILMTFILVSCGGGGQGTASLSVSRGFFLANTSFSGGIYITGEKIDGSESFSAAIITGNTKTVSISFGTWNFKVVGWDGGTLQTGTPYCKYVSNYSFTTEGQALEISTTNAECFSDSNISGTNQHLSANTFKSLVVNTCGANFISGNTNMVNGSVGLVDICSSADTEYKKKYSYFKLHLESISPGGTRVAGIATSCLSAQTLTQTVKFPNRIPVTMKFYSDSSCLNEVEEFQFKKGLDSSQSPTRSDNAFDWAVTADSVSFFVSLPTGASKRSTTAFHSEVPVFKCDESGSKVPCTKYAPASAGTYYLDPDAHAVIGLPESTCSIPSFSGFSGQYRSCEIHNGKAFVSLMVTSTTPATGSLSMNGNTYTVVVGNTNAGYSSDRVRDAYKTMKRVLGFRNLNQLNSSLQDDFDEGNNEAVGILDSAIYEISAMGAGGSFYDYYMQCSTAALSQVSRSYVKDGFTYTVLLSGISGTAPGFTARGNQPEWMSPEVHYNRKIIVRKLVGGTLTTEKIIDISCDNDATNSVSYIFNSAQVRNGKLEEQRTYSYSADRVVELKKIIYWNTSSSDTARFDVYRQKHVKNATGTTQKIERNFYRASKTTLSSHNDFKIFAMNYETVRDGSSFDETVWTTETDGSLSAGNVSYSHKRLMKYRSENATVGDIFGTTFAYEMNKIQQGFKPLFYEVEQPKVSSVGDNFVQLLKAGSNYKVRYTYSGVIQSETYGGTADNVATDISPDGTKMAFATNIGTTIYYSSIINGAINDYTLTASSTPSDLKVGIRNDGSLIVAYIESATQQVHWNLDGTPSVTAYTSFDHHNLEIHKDSTEFYVSFIRDGASTQHLELCKASNLSCNGYASRVSASPFTYSSLHYLSGNFYTTYIHDGIIYNATVSPATLMGGAQTSPPNSRYFVPYHYTNYMPLDSATLLRSSSGTDIDVYYPYFNPTITGFQLRPSYLKGAIFDSYFTSGFTAVNN